jgi:hypothetical protein
MNETLNHILRLEQMILEMQSIQQMQTSQDQNSQEQILQLKEELTRVGRELAEANCSLIKAAQELAQVKQELTRSNQKLLQLETAKKYESSQLYGDMYKQELMGQFYQTDGYQAIPGPMPYVPSIGHIYRPSTIPPYLAGGTVNIGGRSDCIAYNGLNVTSSTLIAGQK